jgi:hypothetical protein
LEFKFHDQETNQPEEISEDSSAINHIQISAKHTSVFLSHEENFSDLGKRRKTPIQVFNTQTGSFMTEYRMHNLSVQSMTLLDDRDILIILSAGQHKLFLVSTVDEEHNFI